MNKEMIALFCIILVVSMPFAFAEVAENVETDFSGADTDEEYGENLIIEIAEYQPTVVPASLMEEESIPIMAVLSASRSSLVQVPKDIRVNIKLLDEKSVSKKNTSLEGTSKEVKSNYYRTYRWRPNRNPTLDNLGYLEIWLRKVEKEDDVPDSIDLDFRAEITYKADITGFGLGGDKTFNLPVETEEEFEEDIEKHDFWNLGYVRVVSATEDKVGLQFYDVDLQKTNSFSVSKGRISSRKRIEGHSYYEYFRVEYNGLVDEDVRVEFKGGGCKGNVCSKESKVKGDWEISEINKEEKYVILKNKEDGYSVDVEDKNENVRKVPVGIVLVYGGYSDKYRNNDDDLYSFAKINDLEKIMGEECEMKEGKMKDDETCMIYKTLSKDVDAEFSDKDYSKEEVEIFTKAIKELRGLELKSIGTEIIREARIKIGGRTYSYEGKLVEESFTLIGKYRVIDDKKGDKVEGASSAITDRCKLNSIGKNYVSIEYTSNYPKDLKGTTETLYAGNELKKFDCGEPVEFVKIEGAGEASFTILPGSGIGKSVSDFSLHIPIEKRLIDLSPDEIDNQISKTKELLEDLEKTITKLEKVVEGWTMVCLGVAAIFTVNSFLQGLGGGAAAAKDRVVGKGEDGVGSSQMKYKSTSGKWVDVGNKGEIIRDKDGDCWIQDKENKNIKSFVSCGGFRNGDKYYGVNDEGNYYILDGNGKFSSSKNLDAAKVITFGNNGDVTAPLEDKDDLPDDCEERYDKYFIDSGDYEKDKIEDDPPSVFVHWDRSLQQFRVIFSGRDGELSHFSHEDGNKGEDVVLCTYSEKEDEGRIYAKKFGRLIDAKNKGDGKAKFEGNTYKTNTRKFVEEEVLECNDVMSPGQCKILYNACDPVICPSSRCNLGGKYYVDNVPQSGLIGSTMLCLPNIKDGIIMPVCLSGILASLKTIRSVLQGYISCLEAAKVSGKSVGICDKIRSVYICEIIWKEALTFMKMKGGILGWMMGGVTGGGGAEYFGGGFDKAGDTVDYFTNNYAKNVFASYKGRASEEIGSEICKSAIYGKTPWYGNIVDQVTDAQNPPQFTVYMEEHEYSDVGREKMSRYQVYYHIYAGNKEIDYRIYLKKGGRTYLVPDARGRIEENAFVDENPDFVAESGFEEVCIDVNDRPYCGFGKIVSTSAAFNAMNDYMIGYSTGKKINGEDECRAINPGLQEYFPQAQVKRVCSVVDPNANSDKQWKEIGDCGDNNEGVYLGKCWMEITELSPEIKSSAYMNYCEDKNWYVCEAGEKCDATSDTSEIGINRKDVVCCSEPCEDDVDYKELKEGISEEGIYGKIKSFSETICEENQDKDPFDNQKTHIYAKYPEWGEKEENIDDNDEAPMYYDFKGRIYLMCGNCGDAKEMFDEIKGGDYKWEADKEYGKVCKVEGEKTEDKGEEEKESVKKEMKIEDSEINKILSVDKSGKYPVKIESDMQIKSYNFVLSSGTETLLSKEESLSQKEFDIELPLFLKDEFKLSLKIIPEDEGYNSFSKEYTIKNNEEKVAENNALFCKGSQDGVLHAFCLYQKDYRCSDVFYKGKPLDDLKVEQKSINECVSYCEDLLICLNSNTEKIGSESLPDTKFYSYTTTVIYT